HLYPATAGRYPDHRLVDWSDQGAGVRFHHRARRLLPGHAGSRHQRGSRQPHDHGGRPVDLSRDRARCDFRGLLQLDRLEMKDCQPVITIRGLRNSFGEQLIHDGVDLTVCRGEILGVVGGSGTGKSVLLRSIIGLQKPDSGEIEVLGENMIDRDEDEAKNIRRRWGILFQNGALFSTLTVAENVEVPIREYFPYIEEELLDEIASYKIAMALLPPDAGPKYPSELSGGMVKRAGIARALALDPELLFLDEPTSGLDPIAAAGFDQLVLSLQQRLGLTVFLITHDLDTLHSI